MQRVYVRGQYPDRDNKPKRRRDCAKNTQFGPISWRMRRLSKVTVMRRHSVAMAFLSDASETRPEAACRLSNRDSHPNTSFSSEDVWRGPCASTDRDRRLRLLQALVMQPAPQSSLSVLRLQRAPAQRARGHGAPARDVWILNSAAARPQHGVNSVEEVVCGANLCRHVRGGPNNRAWNR